MAIGGMLRLLPKLCHPRAAFLFPSLVSARTSTLATANEAALEQPNSHQDSASHSNKPPAGHGEKKRGGGWDWRKHAYDVNKLDTESINDARAHILAKEAFIIDMDGVVYHGNRLLPGVGEFVAWLNSSRKRFLFLTNSSDKTPDELQRKLARLGVAVDNSHFYTSAQATATFLASQRPNGSVFVIGDPGLHQALYSAGYVMNDVNPDYVVIGETRNYSYEKIEHAVHLVLNGAKLIGTNCDKTDPSPDYPGEVIPAAGSLITPIEKAAGVNAYFVGKPNPLMMRNAVSTLGSKQQNTVIIGDRMDTDILGGMEAGIDSALVLSGVTALKDLRQFSYVPRFVIRGISDLLE